MSAGINLGSRVYCKFAIAGEPGIVMGFTKRGKAQVEWVDLDIGRWTEHDPENLVIDEAFVVSQKVFDFEAQAA